MDLETPNTVRSLSFVVFVIVILKHTVLQRYQHLAKGLSNIHLLFFICAIDVDLLKYTLVFQTSQRNYAKSNDLTST